MATIEKRIGQTGKVTHRVKIWIKGCPTAEASFERLTDAKRWAVQTEAAMREGRYFKTRQAQRHTLAEVIERYIRDVLPHKGSKPKQQKLLKMQLEWWKDKLGVYFLSDVTASMIAQQRDNFLSTPRKADKCPTYATINRYLAVLSHASTIAQKEWGFFSRDSGSARA